MTHRKYEKRKSALERLELQLKSNEKPEKIDGKTTDKKIPLSEADKKRIKKDIEVLNDKLKGVSTSTY